MCKKAAFLLISFCTWNIIKSQLEADNQRLPPYPLHRLSRRKRCRLKGYLSVQQTADKWGVSVRWVIIYLKEEYRAANALGAYGPFLKML
jgi:hypothetical protein